MQIDSDVIDIDWQLENSAFEQCTKFEWGAHVDVQKSFIIGFFETCF